MVGIIMLIKSPGPGVAGGGRILPIMDYTGRLRSKQRGSFFRLDVYKRVGFYELKYRKG